MTQEQIIFSWYSYSDHLKEMMKKLIKSDKTTDVTLVCEDKTRFKAHKFVLTSCSSVFEYIIDDMPTKEESVIYLRGVFQEEMKAILQFMYMGQATFYDNKINDLLNIAKILEIKELVSASDFNSEDQWNDQKVSYDISPSHNENLNEIKSTILVKVSRDDIDFETGQNIDTENTSIQNESCRYPCNKCDKHFKNKHILRKHVKGIHGGIEYPCNRCSKSYTQKSDLERHIQSVHIGTRFQCDSCESIFSGRHHLQSHKKHKHISLLDIKWKE